MADPRFYDNRGPLALRELCARVGSNCPSGADADALIHDVAALAQAGPAHLSFFDSVRARADFMATKAGWCLVGNGSAQSAVPPRTILLPVPSVGRAFRAIAESFYPDHELDIREQTVSVHPTSRVAEGVVLGPGVIVGPDAQIGEKSRIGAHTILGRGVSIGRNCQIGSHVVIQFSLVGDEVLIQSGAIIGGSGFGFTSGADGHEKTPQLGRVIIQDRVEVGGNTTIDRGAISDTVIGEGSKIDNLVQIGHNTVIGRHCVLAGQVGVSGSVVLGDFVILGGKVGIADHVRIGDRVRVAALSGIAADLESGRDYAGIPARPAGQWKREVALLASMVKRNKKKPDE